MRVEQPRIKPTGVIIKSGAEIDVMRRAGAVVAKTIDRVLAAVSPGVTTKELDDIAYGTITGEGATPSFLGYRGFPASICTSLNEEVVHGIPGNRRLEDGDILSIDCGAIVEGFHGDSAVTISVGETSELGEAVTACAEDSLYAAIEQCRVGVRMGDVSAAAQACAERRGLSVVREYVGHGIGRDLHEEPSVPNFGEPGRGLLLRKGLVLAIEPMVNAGGWKTRLLSDGWTVVTGDGALSAHYEHTVAILEDGPEILTARRDKDYGIGKA